jgi:hypothetical protein
LSRDQTRPDDTTDQRFESLRVARACKVHDQGAPAGYPNPTESSSAGLVYHFWACFGYEMPINNGMVFGLSSQSLFAARTHTIQSRRISGPADHGSENDAAAA